MHGSAPDIAGRGIADPTALLLAVAMMLEHAGRHDLATRLRGAIDDGLNVDRIRSGDLGGKASTKGYTEALVRRIGAGN